jgi:cell wall-associated NlpC family hydrolase
MRIATAHLRSGTALALAILLALLAAPRAAHGVPSTPEIAAKQAEASAAQAELEDMNAALEVQVEEYNAITEALEQTRDQIRLTREDLLRAERDLVEARRSLGDRAAAIYRDGGSGVLDVFLGARTFDELVMRLDLAVRINRSDANMVMSVKEAKARVEAAELTLVQRQAEQVALQGEVSARAERIEAEVAAQQRFVGQLTDEVKGMIAAEEERQRQAAAERARQAALAAAAAAARGGSSAGREATDVSALKPGRPEVVVIALQYLGVPYAWGGSTPAGFDCSGLTQYAYRQVGVTLPRTSQSQFNAGQHIARDRLDLLQPGDLVFFGTDGDASRVHHVGMYVGSGNYVHAPHTGAVVRVDSLTGRISDRGDYVGASRF